MSDVVFRVPKDRVYLVDIIAANGARASGSVRLEPGQTILLTVGGGTGGGSGDIGYYAPAKGGSGGSA